MTDADAPPTLTDQIIGEMRARAEDGTAVTAEDLNRWAHALDLDTVLIPDLDRPRPDDVPEHAERRIVVLWVWRGRYSGRYVSADRDDGSIWHSFAADPMPLAELDMPAASERVTPEVNHPYWYAARGIELPPPGPEPYSRVRPEGEW